MTTPADSPPCSCASTAQPCGCCEGVSDDTPVAIDNRPGLAAIRYRPGTWAQFKSSMLADLSTTPALAGLRTRNDDDFTIALLDAWAVICDILTFYQERIANEAYLRTATELISVGELAKLIGYKLRPGLAAAAPLAFTLAAPAATAPGPNTPPSGAPAEVTVPTGTQGQTVPDPGAQPATFETIAPITARPEWNAIAPRPTRPVAAVAANAAANLRLQGLITTIKVGDTLLLAAGGTKALNRVAAINQDTATRTTVVQFEANQPQQAAPWPSAAPPSLPKTAALAETFCWDYIKGFAWSDQTQLLAYATTQGWSIDTLEQTLNALRGVLPPGAAAPLSVYAMGTDAAVFGHNAQEFKAIPATTTTTAGMSNWDNDNLGDNATTDLPWVDLDNVYPITVGDQVALASYTWAFFETEGVIEYPSTHLKKAIPPAGQHSLAGIKVDPISWILVPEVFFTTVAAVQVVTRSAYLLSSKLTTIQLTDSPPQPSMYGIRQTRVFVETPPALAASDLICDEPLEGGTVRLDGAYLALHVGQQVAVTGTRADSRGLTASEVATITGLALVDGYTVLSFDTPLAASYLRATVTINANVAPATHGVTTNQILGSGNAAQTFQSFALNQTPLTYVSATTPSGAVSTLTVRVDGVEWTQVDWLYGCGPTDRVYTVIVRADQKRYVQFGDGVTGARPRTGTNNIIATYRYGIGTAGLARPGQISTLLTRSYGLTAVTNPQRSSGAADPETVIQARGNAPESVMTLGRIVSLRDVADFAAASAGIAKAAVNWTWDGVQFVACATVAGVDGAPVAPSTSQYSNLLAAMFAASDGTLPIALCSYQSVTFSVGAAIVPDPTLDDTTVLAVVKTALAAAFSFDNRSFGQPVYASEVIDVIQNVPGVIATTLTALHYSGSTTAAPQPALPAAAPTLGPHGLLGAVLLTLEPGTLPAVVIAT